MVTYAPAAMRAYSDWQVSYSTHDDVIKWKHFPRYWPFVRGIHRTPVNSPHKGQWLGDLRGFFYLRLNKRLNKQCWGWWFEMHRLWRHCNENIAFFNHFATLQWQMQIKRSKLRHLLVWRRQEHRQPRYWRSLIGICRSLWTISSCLPCDIMSMAP